MSIDELTASLGTMTPSQPKKLVGRPSIFTQEIADEIIQRIANGETLLRMCEDKHLPFRSTVIRWKHSNLEFGTAYARARKDSADAVDERIMQVADDCIPDTAVADRVKIDAYKWRAANLNREIYGDNKNVNVSGTINLQAIVEATMQSMAAPLATHESPMIDVTPDKADK